VEGGVFDEHVEAKVNGHDAHQLVEGSTGVVQKALVMWRMAAFWSVMALFRLWSKKMPRYLTELEASTRYSRARKGLRARTCWGEVEWRVSW